MAEGYTSQIALVLDGPVGDVGAVVDQARKAGDIDRAAPVSGAGHEAQEVHWGGRMQKAVVRQIMDGPDGRPLLRTEAFIGGEGLIEGLRRQAQLLQALARQLKGHVEAVLDLSAQAHHDEAWIHRLAVGSVSYVDGINAIAEGEGTWWVHTHGAARLGVPDLELYGLAKAQVEPAQAVLRDVHARLLRGGLRTELVLPDRTPLRLVPVLEAWPALPLDWPGVGRAGKDRGEGLAGPRATLSVLRKTRLGGYKLDLEGVIERIR